MNLTRRMQVLVGVSLALLCATANAQHDDLSAQIKQLQKDQQTLNAEVTQINATLQAILAELQGSKTDQAILKLDGQMKDIRRQLAALAQGKQEKKKRQPDTKVYDVKIGSSPVLGPKDAPVTIVEWVDLQCPYCAREYPKIKEIRKAYPDKVRVVFKHFPLSFHTKAKPVHATTELARRELGDGGFWQMHDMIIDADRKGIVPSTDPKDPTTFDYSVLRGYAERLGMNLNQFDAVVGNSGQMDAMMAPDIAEGRRCGVRGTPTVMINGLKLADRSLDGYKARINEILKSPKGGPRIKVKGPGSENIKVVPVN